MSATPLGGSIEHHSGSESLLNDPLIEHHGTTEPDFRIEPHELLGTDEDFDSIEQFASAAHTLTGWDQVQSVYGFRGTGQTVAVIDSGIAYDHWALGGGFGSNYRVVGGWDFSEENDANPYDDGPYGSHGTHVAGVIGSSAGTNTGVAPDVDLVALRVFNDAGEGYFSWVEQALQWTYTNRNAFENPITAVNLSLGSDWNSNTIPNWATLEDEFEALKSAGIFIAVSAGNSFTTYDAPGLSYPAASPSVVPVMSVDDDGSMSFYSQRDTRAIAAPGSFVTSTVPDYEGNDNGIADDFAMKSGTTTAAPYIAGASVLIREAMEFAGYTNITQDTIYDHMMATADTFYDSVTTTNYKRLNLWNAIDALMPDDDYGSTSGTAYDLGTINGSDLLSGTIHTLEDNDYFRFTAGATGTISFTASSTHGLTPDWLGNGEVSGSNGEIFTVEVIDGLTYVIGLTTGDGVGHYDIEIVSNSDPTNTAPVLASIGNKTVSEGNLLSFTATATDADGNGLTYSLGAGAPAGASIHATTGVFNWTPTEAQGPGTYSVTVRVTDNGSPALSDSETISVTIGNSIEYVDWGSVNQESIDNVSQSAERRYRVQTTRAGYLTAEAYFAGTDVELAWLDESEQQVAFGADINGGQRVDFYAANGKNYYLQVIGASSDIDFRLTNLVSVSGTSATVNGTRGADSFTFLAGASQHMASVNGVTYQFDGAAINKINFNGSTGTDEITLTGTKGNESATLEKASARLNGNGYSVEVGSIGNITIFGGGGNDSIGIYGTGGDDLYSLWSDRARMSGSGYFNEARHFNTTIAYANGGYDRAHLYDSSADETYTAWWDRVVLAGNGASHDARGFDRTIAKSSGGNDTAIFHDTPGDDHFSAWWDHAVMYGDAYFNDTAGFAATIAHASTGNDQAFLYDSAGDDRYYAWSDHVQMTGFGFSNEAHGFGKAYGTASVGDDRADLFDSAGNDSYTAWVDRVRMEGSGYTNEARDFDRTKGYATAGGDNSATFYDSSSKDVFAAWPDHAVMYGNKYFNDSVGFNSVIGYASDGYDKASFYDSPGNDTYTAWWNRIVMVGDGFRNEARGFDRTMGRGAHGNDSATLHDSRNNDQFSAWPTHAAMYGNGYFNDTWMFKSVVAFASIGNDKASFYDSEGDDIYTTWWNRAVMKGDGFSNDARGFDKTVGRASTGNDRAVMYDSGHNDSVHSHAWGAYMTDYIDYLHEARNFDFVEARRTSGGLDQAFLSRIDYVFELIGGWSE